MASRREAFLPVADQDNAVVRVRAETTPGSAAALVALGRAGSHPRVKALRAATAASLRAGADLVSSITVVFKLSSSYQSA
jgi:hypothetical protein